VGVVMEDSCNGVGTSTGGTSATTGDLGITGSGVGVDDNNMEQTGEEGEGEEEEDNIGNFAALNSSNIGLFSAARHARQSTARPPRVTAPDPIHQTDTASIRRR